MVLASLKNLDNVSISVQPIEQVSLTNGGELSLYFIGTGSAFAKTLNQNNLLVVKGNDHLLIDCGSTCSMSLHQVGLELSAVKNFLITHSHADHIGGLEEAQLFGRYVSQQKPHMIINEEYEDILWNQSLRGGSEMSESQKLGFADLWEVTRPSLVPMFARETWQADIGEINVKMPRTMHFPDDAPSWRESSWSCGVMIDDRILFTSDTRFDPELLDTYDAVYDFDVIFHDCQLFTGGVHASLNELKTLRPELKSKIILMHYGDNWKDFEQEALDAGFQSWAQQGHAYIFPALDAKQGTV